MRRVLLLLALVIAAGAPLAASAEHQRFTSTARDLATGQPLFKEVYEVEVENGRWHSGVTRYFLPDGTAIGERRFDFSRDRYVPVYGFDQSTPEYREGITRVDASGIEVFHVRDGDRDQAVLPRVHVMVGDCGSQPFLIDHLDTLAKGAIVPFTLVVPGKTDSYKLRARKVEEVEVRGKRALRIRIELDNVLRALLPKLELVIDPVTKRLIEYSGITNVKNPATRKAFSARIEYAYP